MSVIVERIYPDVIRKTAVRCRKRGIVIPTFAQLRNPESVPEKVKQGLGAVGLNDVHPLNLFRITWKNDVGTGLYGRVNFIEIPQVVSGVKARIFGLVGKHFPTGAHKVGAAFGCLVPRLVSGEFDPGAHKAVWPSTGNYCRGGAFDCALLGCKAVAVLPEQMSRERFDWLKAIGAEVIATPGCESNVKEIYDKCRQLSRDPVHVIFNQFDEFGNPMFHYQVTGPAIEEAFGSLGEPAAALSAFVSATGSAGTIAAGDFLKKKFPYLKIVAAEALQCPTLLMNGFGAHRIEGIGDKHIPWIHNLRNTDAVAAVDDEDCLRILRLFNEQAGLDHLVSLGMSLVDAEKLSLLGISGICNLLAAIKTARYFDMGERDVIFTVFTDSVDLYRSRLAELQAECGPYRPVDASRDHAAALLHQRTDFFSELKYSERKAIHNLKYFTWIEQQGKSVEELNSQWDPGYWDERFVEEAGHIDRMIEAFNREVASS